MASSCTRYIKATATFWFPEGHYCCDLCPALETYSRKQCRLTGEYLYNTKETGFDCPLHLEKEDRNRGNIFEEIESTASGAEGPEEPEEQLW